MVSFESLTYGETRVLAALNKSPLGMGSIHAVARRAGVAYSTAHRALIRLTKTGLVTTPVELMAWGRVVRTTIYYPNRDHPSWNSLVTELRQVPIHGPHPDQPAKQVPRYLRHLFWNTHTSQMNVNTAGAYIAGRLLANWRDSEGIAWGVNNLPPEAWEEGSKAHQFNKQDRALARNLAQQAQHTGQSKGKQE